MTRTFASAFAFALTLYTFTAALIVIFTHVEERVACLTYME